MKNMKTKFIVILQFGFLDDPDMVRFSKIRKGFLPLPTGCAIETGYPVEVRVINSPYPMRFDPRLTDSNEMNLTVYARCDTRLETRNKQSVREAMALQGWTAEK